MQLSTRLYYCFILENLPPEDIVPAILATPCASRSSMWRVKSRHHIAQKEPKNGVHEANHWLFQLANTCLLLSYASKDLLMLRIVLMLAGLFFVLWGSLALTVVALDTVIWNSIFCLINAARITQLVWERR